MVYQYYNLTNLSNAGNETTILTFVGGVNDIMGGFPALMMLVSIGIVLFLTMIAKGFNVFQSMASISFVMLILSMILYPMDLIAGSTLVIFAILCPICVFLLWVWGGNEFG